MTERENLRNKFCPRCGLTKDSREFIQVKTISCPACGEPAIRSKAIYRASRSEHFYCTNANCKVRIVIITQRDKELQLELPKESRNKK